MEILKMNIETNETEKQKKRDSTKQKVYYLKRLIQLLNLARLRGGQRRDTKETQK